MLYDDDACTYVYNENDAILHDIHPFLLLSKSHFRKEKLRKSRKTPSTCSMYASFRCCFPEKKGN